MGKGYCCRHDPIVRKIFLTMLVPTILMNLTTAIGSMADTMIIGHYLDDAALSVVTFATPIYMVINTLAALFAVGGCIAMSIDVGKGEKDTANLAFSMSVELMILFGVLLMLVGLFFSGNVTAWLGAGEDVFESVRQYAGIVLLGAPIFILNIGIAFFVRNDGRPTLAMVGMLLSIFVDIILNVVFVGVMDLGVPGAAYSTVLGQLVSVLVIGSHFLSSKNTLRFRLTCNAMVLRIVKNGAGAALHFVYQFLTILIINRFLAKLEGTDGIVVYTVVFNLSTVSLSVFEGISQTIQPMIGNYYGEKSYKNIKQTMYLAFVSILVICGSVTLALETAPELVPMAFGLDDDLLILASAEAVRIYAAAMIMTTVNVVIGYYLQSTEHSSMAAVLISLRCFVIFLAATIILGILFGMNGVWAAYAVAEVLSFVICVCILLVKRRKLTKSGTEVDLLLLETAIEQSIECYTCRCREQDALDFQKTVLARLEQHPELPDHLLKDAQAYLARLSQCITHKKGTYIELELNAAEKKIMIRDNLDHTVLQSDMQASVQHGSKADYGPVLGWNRICLR